MQGLLDALYVLQKLREANFDVVLAGGAVRDIAHGRTPKDYDILMMCDAVPPLADVLDALDRLPLVVSTEPFGEGASMDASPDPKNLEWVIKAQVGETVIDIIQQATAPTTAEEVVEAFDCTLNMIWLHEDFTVVTHSEYPKAGGLVRMLPLCDYPKLRAAYLSSKYPEYQWPEFPETPTLKERLQQGATCAAV